jgi:hypothetical protein
MPMTLKGVRGFCLFETKKSQQACGATQLYTNDTNRIRNYHS